MSTEQILETQATTTQVMLSTILQNQVVIMKALIDRHRERESLQEQIKTTQELVRYIG